MELEGGERVFGAVVEGESFGNELDSDTAGGEALHKLCQVDDGTGEPVHRRDPHGVTAADMPQQPGERWPIGAVLAADPVGERLFDIPDRGLLPDRLWSVELTRT